MNLRNMRSTHVQFGTHRHFKWLIIPILTQIPTALMFMDINDMFQNV